MHNFKELKIWQESRKFCKLVYQTTKPFPDSEKFGLTSQIRRAVVSILSNIAEGAGRKSTKDFANFIGYSLGSSFELETQLLLASDLEFISEDELNKLLAELYPIQKMINKFYNHLTNPS